MRFVNGFFYMQPAPFDAPGPDGPKSHDELGAEIGRRTGLAAAAFEQRIWRDVLRRWDDESSRQRSHVTASSPMSTSALDDDELRDQLHQRISWLTEMATSITASTRWRCSRSATSFSTPSLGPGAPGADVRRLRRLVPGVGGRAAGTGAVVDAVSGRCRRPCAARQRRPGRGASRRAAAAWSRRSRSTSPGRVPARGGFRSHQPDDRRAARHPSRPDPRLPRPRPRRGHASVRSVSPTSCAMLCPRSTAASSTTC